MKLVATIFTTALAGIVSTAAMAADRYEPSGSYDWSGLYVGVHGGLVTGDSDVSLVGLSALGVSDRAIPGQGFNTDLGGGYGGGQIGYNWQTGSWVYGVEGYVSVGGIDGTTLSTFGAADDNYTTDIQWIAGASVKVGYAFDRALIYAKGGYTGANIDYSIVDVIGLAGAGSSSEWHHGYAIGAGFDFAVTDNVIAGLEYRYSDFGDKVHAVTVAPGQTIFDNVGAQIHSFQLNLSYKF